MQRPLREIEYINDEGAEQIRASRTDAFLVETPPQMEKIWDNLALLPPKAVDAIRAYTIELEEVQGQIRRSTPTPEEMNSDVVYVLDRDRVVTGYRAVIAHTEAALQELAYHLA